MTGNGSLTPPMERTRLRDAALPGWRRWALPAAIAWALGYGALRVYWSLTGDAISSGLHADLVFTGWWPVGLCGAAALVVLGLGYAKWSWSLAIGGWLVASGLVVASALLLLDLVGLVLPGLGVTPDLTGVTRRVLCLAGGLLVGASALFYRRYWRGACLACGRLPGETRPVEVPRWARVAAWAAVAGWLVRLLAQLAIGLGSELLRGDLMVVLFEVGFMLAGTVLPLALISRWGRVSPAWLPGLAGRRVPRWLVLAPALTLGVGMTAYFGLTLVMIAGQTLTGTWQQGDVSLPLWFFWVAVPAYLIWGLGLAVAALAYRRTTTPACRVCSSGS